MASLSIPLSPSEAKSGASPSAAPTSASPASPTSPTSAPSTPAAPEVLLLGCTAAGKTVLLRQFKRYCTHKTVKSTEYQQRVAMRPISLATTSTTGFDRVELSYDNVPFIVREVGGPMKSTWPNYSSKSQAICFVIDRSAPSELASAAFELAIILNSPNVNTQPLWILLNKSDSMFAMPSYDISCMFDFSDTVYLRSRLGAPTFIVETSGITAEGVVPLLKQIVSVCGKQQEKEQEKEANANGNDKKSPTAKT